MQTRKPLRLPAFDYGSPRLYFVTTCTRRRGDVLGHVVPGAAGDAIVELNALGIEVASSIESLAGHGCRAGTFVVMPDHVHLVIGLQDGGPSLAAIVGGLKASVVRRSGARGLWQRGYHDRVIRDEHEQERIADYITANPARWLARAGDTGVAPTTRPWETQGRDRPRP